ncbi:MAG: Fe-S cluster assembly protein SufB [Candidatus Heimdallarchaeota archaeon]|nr:Fe-S cluster assembly protein SufB [Candidatus Heimdallarchaeota archaeon]MDH5645745.1 Fe-S cluster assembly protein SufB [Candidatus Heimdallarchaeota archaeon]
MGQKSNIEIEYSAGWSDPENYTKATNYGLSEDIVKEISKIKNEPKWMTEFRLRSLQLFNEMPTPKWADPIINSIDFQKIRYYVTYSDKAEKSWDDVPDNIKNTFDRLGIPEAERKFLAGVGAQYDSETVYHKLREDLEAQGIIFLDTDTGLKEYEDVFRKYFGTVIPPEDNKFSALNSAVWSGGSFIIIPKGIKVDIPLQAYFRINTKNVGQFERTLIIAEPGSDIQYIEGCTAPTYTTDSLHSAVVELIAMEGSRLRYTTIQNWSNNVYNLVTKRAHAHKNARVEWVDGNIGSKLTMKYPAVYLMGEGARGEVLTIAYAGNGQHQDSGAKMIHLAPRTHSKITAKSISKGTGKTTYRGLVQVAPNAKNVVSNVICDALLIDDESKNDTFPYSEIQRDDATITHEATVGKINQETLFYLMSRGIPENEALALVVMGFFDPFTKELPMEYAVELNRLIEMEMEGAIG